MTWLILLSHAFNPLLIAIALKQQDKEKTEDSDGLAAVFTGLITSFLLYLFWLGVHFLVIKIIGSNFDFDGFIGVGKGIAYFLPFLLGVVILLMDALIQPRLRVENIQLLLSSLRSIILFFGIYFMLINYLAWIAK
jgi:hypothetical protein